jgi:hypothetical protein
LDSTTGSANKVLHDTREAWLRAAADQLRPYFQSLEYPLPEKIRFAIAFPSTGRRGNRIGECWPSSASEDGFFEIIIRADLADPVEVLGVLVHELTHAALPKNAMHGKEFRAAATKIGLTGKMVHAMPGELLQKHLADLAAKLGPLPHARLDIKLGLTGRSDDADDEDNPADVLKKQRARLLKAQCKDQECGYTVRVTSKWVVDVGAPHCPRHGAMRVDDWENPETVRPFQETRAAALNAGSRA